MKVATLSAFLAGAAYAQSGAWQQCSGSGFSGSTTCVAGFTCSAQNQWYSQCVPATGGSTPSTAPTSAPSTAPTTAPSTAKPAASTAKPATSSTPTVVPTSAPTTSAPPSNGGGFCDFPKAPQWTSTGLLANPQHGWESLKDFTNVVYNGKHIVIAYAGIPDEWENPKSRNAFYHKL
ncbi:hypothetical protein AC1031_000554 [Aphanomyces cochlioides]|nr:hypothetical protein AC1031_000554 [Aphanomyces cochlioides]